MATVTFEAETLGELIRKMKMWIGEAESGTGPGGITGAVEKTTGATSELAKAAIGLVASAAPEPISSSEIFKRLTSLGFEISDTAQKTIVSTLDSLAQDGADEGLIEKVDRARDAAIYEMSQAVARGVLRVLGL
ncbi:MAG: hypothetical protein M0Z47_05165 [Actinomycetota bacterium]|nr:hypothetical protein [Actinomycetota bacterium]